MVQAAEGATEANRRAQAQGEREADRMRGETQETRTRRQGLFNAVL